jgi:NADH-quinone oxidoreductase subunit H
MTHLLDSLSEFQIFLLLTIVKVVVVLVITLTAVAYTVLLERKVLGRMQNRWGPSRVGPVRPAAAARRRHQALPQGRPDAARVERRYSARAHHRAGCALISMAVVPFGAVQRVKGVDIFQIADVNIGLLVILGITSIGVYGIALSGWSSNNKFALLGSLRATAQVISYELALAFRWWASCCAPGRSPARHRRQPGYHGMRRGTSSAASSSSPSSST